MRIGMKRHLVVIAVLVVALMGERRRSNPGYPDIEIAA
jgi:hypothetical protein